LSYTRIFMQFLLPGVGPDLALPWFRG